MGTNKMAKTLGVFLKEPVPGKVKTRLATKIGNAAAALLYSSWLDEIFDRLQSLRSQVRLVALFDGVGEHAFDRWHGFADDWIPQASGDLGNRLDAAFRLLTQGNRHALAIGTDCLELNEDRLLEAFDRLERADVVLGPATDGGYYLIGCQRHYEGLFDRVRWSSEQTLANQFTRATELRLRCEQLQPMSDIDTWEDWCEYCRRTGKPNPFEPVVNTA